jgi:glycosyltransferase involved in cell wall biosynthesis
MQTAAGLTEAGYTVTIHLANETIDYEQYTLIHFFNITRPADILLHIRKSRKPYVISPIYVDYGEFDKKYRKSKVRLLLHFLPKDAIEYFKTIARWIRGNDALVSKSYLLLGQKKSVEKILQRAAMVLPNSMSEWKRLKADFRFNTPYRVVPNGINAQLFRPADEVPKNPMLVLCVARIEGLKNQLNLIKALNNTLFKLFIIGKPAPNQQVYYQECKRAAAANVSFLGAVCQEELVALYQQAKVHVLPSWFETTGLSSLEAAAMGMNIIVTEKGDAREYFGNDAYYCQPDSITSIYEMVQRASMDTVNPLLAQTIQKKYTWTIAASETIQAYNQVINKK